MKKTWVWVSIVAFCLYVGVGFATEINSVKLGDTDTRIRKGTSGIEVVQGGAVTATLPASGTGFTLPSGSAQTITAASGLYLNVGGNNEVYFPDDNSGLEFVPATAQTISAAGGLYLNVGGNNEAYFPADNSGLEFIPVTEQTVTAAGGLVVNTNITDQVRFPTTGGITFIPAAVQTITAASGLYLNNGANQMYMTDAGGISFPPSSTQAISAAGDTISANASYVVLNPSADTTLTSTPTIADGKPGQILYMTVAAASIYTVTLQDQDTLAGSNLQLGASTRAIGDKDSEALIFDGTDWIELSYTNSDTGT